MFWKVNNSEQFKGEDGGGFVFVSEKRIETKVSWEREKFSQAYDRGFEGVCQFPKVEKAAMLFPKWQ